MSENANTNSPGLGDASVDPGNPDVTLDLIGALGHVGWLLSQSTEPHHRDAFISDLEWRVLPPLALGQLRIWRKDNMPVAMASWAFLGAEQEARLQAGGRRLAPLDWKSGENVWLVDVVAPFGERGEVLKELARSGITAKAEME